MIDKKSLGIKRIQEVFSEEEYNELIEVKGNLTWREFILTLLNNRKKVLEISNKYVGGNSN